jgi:glycosyltransferase involved in cell wall biosynthesis
MSDVRSAAAARRLDYPAGQLEIIVARGRHPSVQRNTALQAARGDLVYFLDDDIEPDPRNLRRIAALFENGKVAMVGGPSLCPPDAPALERVFALALSAWLAFGPSRARYAKVGERRESSEKELILCNLAARRSAVLESGGFDEALYPNEENALMDALQQRGYQLVYDPECSGLRRPRRTLRGFVRMLVTYGRGRAEQFRLHPTPGSALNFVPPLFCVYLLALPAAVLWPWILGPLAIYGLVVILQTLALFPRGGWLALPALPLIVITHVFYGFGFWRGLFTKLDQREDRGDLQVSLETSNP